MTESGKWSASAGETARPGPVRGALAGALLAAALGVTACGGPSAPTPSPAGTGAPRAVVGVDVVPMDGRGRLAGQTVVIRGDRIAALGPAGEVAVPEGAQRIDGAGRTLVPGLFDAHVHIRREEHLILYLAHGITTVANLFGESDDLERRRRVARGELLGPHPLTCGPRALDLTEPVAAEALVRREAAAGYDCVKVYGESWTREAYHRLVSTGRQVGIPVIGHAPRNLPFRAVLEERQGAVVHLEEAIYTHPPFVAWLERVSGDGPAPFRGEIPPEVVGEARRLAAEVREAGVWFSPALVAFENLHVQLTDRAEAMMARPAVAYLNPLTEARWRARIPSMRREADRPWWDAAVALQRLLLRELHAAGVVLAAGTDATNPITLPGVSIHRELAAYVEAGMTPYEALATATLRPAQLFGVEGEIGTVTEGKRADLLLVDADPLTSVGNLTEIAGVFRAGRWLPAAELEARLAALEAGYAPLRRQVREIEDRLARGGAAAAVAALEAIEAPEPELAGYVETAVNAEGYRLLGAGEVEAALEAFRLNVETFPGSANTYDSLAEAYLEAGERARAVALYRRALEVDPAYDHARQMLEQLGE